ncbi:MAG: SDR family NAD(P)-dependent oxidoreductase [Promethearchaeota archaeon]
MKGRIILITGSTDGIGKQTAIDLAKMGAFVIIHGRNEKKAKNALKEVKKIAKSDQLEAIHGDLASFSQIHDISDQLHKRFDHLDVLVNNAGVNFWEKTVSVDGFERTLAVNYLAPYILTLLVLDLLKKGSSSRIVNVTSDILAQSIDFDNLQNYQYTFEVADSGKSAYGISKACLNMFTFDLSEKLKEKGITANCVHPGGIDTKMLRKTIEMMGWDRSIAQPLSEGSNSLVNAISSPKLENTTGKYLYRTQIHRSTDITYDFEARKKLRKLTEKYTSMKLKDY